MPTETPSELLKRFGLSSYRPGQQDVIDTVLAGHDCLCIMPTGGGKSLCYQIPAIAREGVTVVVSPLIALMKDQVDSLQQIGIRAELLNSTLSSDQQEIRLGQLASSALDLIYVAPERFRSPRFLEAIRQAKVTLLAVDEAHCISEWGHDFRHDYARLGSFRQQIGNPQTIALTATATQEVRDDVAKQLNLVDPQIFISGFARPNLRYRAMQQESKPDKMTALVDFLRTQHGSGIIYASTRKGCEEIAHELRGELRRRTLVYHGGMLPEERRTVQEEFMSGDGLIVATNAFGMGIDKPDVRFVIHFNIPGTLEAYYQEAGLAGRDGASSDCLLIYSSRDRYIQEFFIESAHPQRQTIAAVYEYLRKQDTDPIELTQDELKDALDIQIGTDGVGTCERLLEKTGVLERLEPNRNMAAVRIETDAVPIVDTLPAQARKQRKVIRAIDEIIGGRRFERVFFRPVEVAAKLEMEMSALNTTIRQLTKLEFFDYVPPFRGRAVHMLRRDLAFTQLDIDFADVEQRRQANLAKLQRVIQYAVSNGCRQLEILSYFGDDSADVCGNCDNCIRNGRASAKAATSAPTTSELLDPVKMVLSGVARTGGRFGSSTIAAMLCGSTSKKVTKWKLDQLSTFGLLSFLKQTECNELIKAMVGAQLLEQADVDLFRPTLKMTELGRNVMTGRVNIPPVSVSRGIVAKVVANRIVKGDEVSARIETADEEVIEHPEVDTATSRTDPPEADHPDSETTVRTIRVDETESQKSEPHVRGGYYWSWRLLSDGYSIREVQEIRGIDLSTALDHLVRASEDGLKTKMEWIASKQDVQHIREMVGDLTEPPRADSPLPHGLHYQHFQIFLKSNSGAKCLSKTKPPIDEEAKGV